MKILRVISSGFKEGGAENGVVQIQSILEERGHTVKILSSDLRPELPHFNDYSYRAPRGFFRKVMYTFNPYAYRALKKAIREFKPDVIHLHTLGTASPLILWALAGLPTVATVHGPEVYTKDLLVWFMPKSDFKNSEYEIRELRPMGKIRYFYYRYINFPLYSYGLRYVDRFVTISTYIHNFMANQGIKSDYIPNGIALFPYEELNVKHLSPALAFSGRLEKYKGVEYLIRAMPAIIEKFPTVVLYLAGEGSERSELQTLSHRLNVDQHVIFLGYISRTDLEKLYQRAAVVVVPSIWPEICSRAGIEAMSVGRPVVGTNVGGTPDWLIENETGYLVPPKDHGAISKAVISLLENPEKTVLMGKKARAKAGEYDITMHALRIEKIYEEIIAQKRMLH